MAACEVLVRVKSKWFSESTKLLRITSDLSFITLSSPSDDGDGLRSDEDGAESSAEQAWRLDEDLIEIDTVPGHPLEVSLALIFNRHPSHS